MNLELERAKAQKMCSNLDITVLPYGNAWWLLGDGINQVIGEIAGLTQTGLRGMQRPYFSRV